MNTNPSAMKPVRLPDHPLNILHLGDSYTIAEGLELEDGWPYQLHDQFVEHGMEIAKVQIIARNAWTTTDLLEAATEADLQPEWDLITLCIGVNNQYRGLELDAFQHEFGQLIETASAALRTSGAPLLLLTIPDWGSSPFASDRDQQAIATAIDQFNEGIMKLAAEHNCPAIDWTPLTRKFGQDPTAFAGDGLHPNRKQYARWAELLLRHFISNPPASGLKA
jgi:lysophospholipase L1-like esterase